MCGCVSAIPLSQQHLAQSSRLQIMHDIAEAETVDCSSCVDLWIAPLRLHKHTPFRRQLCRQQLCRQVSRKTDGCTFQSQGAAQIQTLLHHPNMLWSLVLSPFTVCAAPCDSKVQRLFSSRLDCTGCLLSRVCLPTARLMESRPACSFCLEYSRCTCRSRLTLAYALLFLIAWS